MFTQDGVLENSSSSQEAGDFEARTTNPLTLLNEVTPEVQQKIDLIDAVLQARDRKSRREAIQKASEVLGRTTRMIRMRLVWHCVMQFYQSNIAQSMNSRSNGMFSESQSIG